MLEHKEILISQFIDDELELSEKIALLKTVNADSSFTQEAIELLEQEKLMESFSSIPAPAIKNAAEKQPLIRFSFANTASFAALAACFILVIKVFFMPPAGIKQTAETQHQKHIHRFVLHMPDAEDVSVAGTFSGWQNIKMDRAGDSGYWQITLPINSGEHQYSFIVDGEKQMPDPTVPSKQADDFGGENSILKVDSRI